MLYPRSFQQCSVLLAAASDAVSKSCRDRRRPCWKLRSSCGSQPIALTAADPRTYTHTANQLLERLGYAPSCRIRALTSPIPRSSLTTRAQANKIEGYTLAGAHTIARSARRAATRSSPPCPRLINVFCYLYRIRSGEIVERGKTRRTCLLVIT